MPTFEQIHGYFATIGIWPCRILSILSIAALVAGGLEYFILGQYGWALFAVALFAVPGSFRKAREVTSVCAHKVVGKEKQ